MNRYLKKGITVAAVIAGLSLGGAELFAQKGMGGARDGKGPRAECPYHGMGQGSWHLNRMQEYLGLTDQQVEKIFKLETDFRQKQFENRKNPEKTAELREAHKKEVEKVFTDEQKKKLDEMPMRKGKRDGKKMRDGNCPYGR